MIAKVKILKHRG